jgi:hypothetical protein
MKEGTDQMLAGVVRSSKKKVQSFSLPCFNAKGFIALRGYILEPYASSLAWRDDEESSHFQKQKTKLPMPWTNGPDRNAAAINGQCLFCFLLLERNAAVDR